MFGDGTKLGGTYLKTNIFFNWKCEKCFRLGLGGVGNISPLVLVIQLLIKHGDCLCVIGEIVVVVLLSNIVDLSAEAGDPIVDDSEANIPSCVLHISQL